jgi:hypothetical protein
MYEYIHEHIRLYIDIYVYINKYIEMNVSDLVTKRANTLIMTFVC